MINHVSLPSHVGAIASTIRSRTRSFLCASKSAPTPRSNPSSRTYIVSANIMKKAEIRGRSTLLLRTRQIGLHAGDLGAKVTLERARWQGVGGQALRAAADEPQREDDEPQEEYGVGADERDQGGQQGRGGHRGYPLGGAQHSVDDPGLAARLGGPPSTERGHDTCRRHHHQGAQEPARGIEPPVPP